jgi:hypothetical protein
LATKADFSEAEWETLRRGVSGAGMLVSMSDRDLSDTFGEMGALGKYLAGQQVAAASELVRQLAKERPRGFGFGTSPDKMRNETMTALRGSVTLLTEKAPDDLAAYRQLVVGIADVVAEAKGGVVPVEASMIAEIKAAVGAA